MQSMGQLPRGMGQNGSGLVDLSLGEGPVAGLEGVRDAREGGPVVAGPELRRVQDVLVLGAVGELFFYSRGGFCQLVCSERER